MFIINTKPHNYVRVGSPVIGIPMLYRSKSSDPPGGGGGGGGVGQDHVQQLLVTLLTMAFCIEKRNTWPQP